MDGRRVVRALAAASHPGPTLAVSVLTALLAVAVGHSWTTGTLLVGAVLTGQLSIGWSNDLLDRSRDRSAGRTDKPLASGELGTRTIVVAIGLALSACVVLSLLCGVPAALAHVLLVGGGWAYNLGLKSTPASFAPYAVAFGALPAVVTLAAPEPAAPPWWMLAAGACLGVGAHLLNAIPDLEDDRHHGVWGLPQRLGARRSNLLAAGFLALGTLLVLVAGVDHGVVRVVGILVLLVLVVATRRGRGQVPFWAAVGTAVLTVVALLAAGSSV